MDSQPGRGTTITVTLRLRPAAVEAPASRGPMRVERLAALRAAGRTNREPTVREAGPRLLIVEDHPVNLSLIRRQVSLLGYQADVAMDGNEALEKWLEGRHGLVLTDCHMPVMDGYELSRRIRAEEARLGVTRPVPVIACTANAMAGDAKLCFDAGMSDYLSKPVTLPALKAKLERWAQAALPPDQPPDPATSTGNTAMEANEHQHPVIDIAALEQFTRGDESLAREIYGQFLSTTRTDGRNLANAVASGDMVTVQATAHRIKGACRMIGANPTADAAEALEKAKQFA